MSNLTTLTITGGIPSGSGTVSTIDNLFGSGATIEVVPTITAGTYTAGYVIGGIMTFASILAPNSNGGLLESITLKFKGSVQTTQFDVAIFTTSPGGTFADNGAPSIIAADSALLHGIYYLTSPNSDLGTHTIYNLDGIGKQIVGGSQSLYAVVITKSVLTSAAASTTDMSLKLGVIW